MADPNLQRIERNVRKMIDLRAPEADIDAYLGQEGFTADKFRSAMLEAKDTRGTGEKVRDYVKGVGDQLISGATLGLSDEFGAGVDATMQTALPNARYTDTGQPLWAAGNTWSERHGDSLKRDRDARKKFADENPIVATLANILGGAAGAPATMIAKPIAALTKSLAKPVQYAAGGAAPGAVYGFNEGEGGLGSRVESGLVGAGIGGFAGLGLGAGADMVAKTLRRVTGGSAQAPVLNAAGQLTDEAKAALQQAGIKPEAISEGFMEAFAKRADDAARAGRPVDQAELARVLQGETLPVPVPQTRGQVTGMPSDQMFENLALKGTYGPRAERFMQTTQQGQQQALGANVEALAEALGGMPVRAEGQIPGRNVQERLAAMLTEERKPVTAAFKAARQTQAGVPADAVAAMRGQLADEIGQAHNLANVPKVANVLKPLEAIGSGEGASVPVNRLFQIREQLNGVIRGGGEDAIAAQTAKRILDGQLDDMISKGLLQGDQAAVEAWRNAIGQYKEFAGRFKGDDLIERLVKTDYRSGARQLVVAPDQATNAIFNAKTLFGGGNTARDLGRLRQVLGPDSPEWMGLRQEAVMRLFQQGRGPVNPTNGDRTFSGANFSNAFDNVMRDAPEVMRAFFTPDEIATLRQFRDVANRVTGVVKGGDNTSNTTVAASNVIQNLLGRIFTSEQAMMRFMAVPVVRAITDYGAGASLAGRVAAQPSRVAPAPTGAQIWGAAGGAGVGAGWDQGQ